MAAVVHTYRAEVLDAAGNAYLVEAWGEQRDHLWYGWLEFRPLPAGAKLHTDRETTQPSWEALRYWASGLEPTYLEGALARALAPDH